MRSKALSQRLWFCLPPLLLYACDVLLTLAGQPPTYWEGNHATARELNPLALVLLKSHPRTFLVAAVLWASLFTVFLLLWQRRWTVVVGFLLAFCHAVGAATWLPRYGVMGQVAAVGWLLAAERLLTFCWRRAEVMRASEAAGRPDG